MMCLHDIAEYTSVEVEEIEELVRALRVDLLADIRSKLIELGVAHPATLVAFSEPMLERIGRHD